MFKSCKKRIMGTVLALALAFVPAGAVWADGTTSIVLSDNSAEVGDTVTVTVRGSDSSSLSLRYNNEVFEYVGCSAAGASTDANVVTFSGDEAQVTLKAIGTGAGDLVVSSDTLSGSSTSVPVSGAAQTQETSETEDASTQEEASETEQSSAQGEASETEQSSVQEETSEPETEQAQDVSSQPADDSAKKSKKKDKTSAASSNASSGDGDFIIGGQEYVLSERFSDSEIPKGFEKKNFTIHGGSYNELTNGNLTLVYLKPADHIEGSGEFYIYDADMDKVSKYAALGSPEYFCTVEKTKKPLSDQLVKTKISVGGETFKVFQIGEDMSDFYYFFGKDSKGNIGWFCYDSAAETIQRANEALFVKADAGVAAQKADDEPQKLSVPKGEGKTSWRFSDLIKSSRTLLAVVIFLLIVVLVVVFDILLFRRNDGGEEDYDYEDDEEYEEESMPPTVEKILEEKDFDEANKPHRARKLFAREKATDIWDTGEKMLSDTSSLVGTDEASKLKKQVFRGRSSESGAEGEEGKVDVIDFNDL